MIIINNEVRTEDVKEERTFVIPTFKMEIIEKLIEKLNRKSKKLDRDQEVKIEVIRTFVEQIENEKSTMNNEYIEFQEVKLNGLITESKGWKFIATLDHGDHGTIVRTHYTKKEIELPESYFQARPICEHCNTKRYRKDTYVIQNTQNKEFKQVGKTCLKDFLGDDGVSLRRVLGALQIIEDIIELEEEKLDTSGIGRDRRMFDLYHFLFATVRIIEIQGFMSASRAELHIDTTSYKAYHDMLDTPWEEYTETEKETATKAIEWIRTLEKEDMEGNYYLKNLHTICLGNYIGYRDFGYVASLIPTYQKALENRRKKELLEKAKLERESTKGISQHIGEIKEKIEMEVELIAVYVVDTMYGYMKINIFKDDQGNTLKWSSSTSNLGNDNLGRYRIKGTIKGHTEYKGEKQTEIIRVKPERI